MEQHSPIPPAVAPRARRRRRWPTVLAIPALVVGLLAATGGAWYASRGLTDAPPTTASRDGGQIPNVNLVEDDIALYYAPVTEPAPAGACVQGITGACATTQAVPSAHSNYARQMRDIVAQAERVLSSSAHRSHRGHAKPALVFDVDDTLVNTYNYEAAMQFAYTPSSNASWVNAQAFPAVFAMPSLIRWAQHRGYAVFFITGRPVSQLQATIGNLRKDGYTVPMAGAGAGQTVFLKNTATPPSYLTCGATCTTIRYKSQTRRHIQSLGYDIVGNFGDQYSDLKGGYAQHTFKLPNPMYYLP